MSVVDDDFPMEDIFKKEDNINHIPSNSPYLIRYLP